MTGLLVLAPMLK